MSAAFKLPTDGFVGVCEIRIRFPYPATERTKYL